MLYLRTIKRVRRRDKIRNKTIRKDIKETPILDHVEKKQMQWFGHLQRMKDDRITNQVWKTKIRGTKRRCRSALTWDGEVSKIMQKKNLTWREGEIAATDRRKRAERIRIN